MSVHSVNIEVKSVLHNTQRFIRVFNCSKARQIETEIELLNVHLAITGCCFQVRQLNHLPHPLLHKWRIHVRCVACNTLVGTKTK